MTNDSAALSQPAGDQRVHIAPYDEVWPAAFEREAVAIRALIGPWITGGIHHVGSTAIPGLAAKPIIDIMAGVVDLPSSRPCIELLAPLDYCYAPYLTEAMHWFCKPRPSMRSHHLHLIPTGSARFVDQLVFRDYLRAHPDAVAEYEAVKRDLAARYPFDREAYTLGKTDTVARLTGAGHRWATKEGTGWAAAVAG